MIYGPSQVEEWESQGRSNPQKWQIFSVGFAGFLCILKMNDKITEEVHAQ